LGVGEFDLGEDLTICEGENTELTAPLEGDYLWSTGSIASEIEVEEEGWYTLEIFEGACGFKDSLFLTVNPLPEFNLGADTIICDTASLVLDAFVDGGTYLWSDGSDTPSIEVADEGDYSVTVTLDGCSSEDEITVEVINCSLSVLSELEQSQFRVFPNPADKQTRVEIPQKLIGGSLSVYNNEGRLVQQIILESTALDLDLSGLRSGFYFIRVEKGLLHIISEVVKR
jgi:hypothetical protein